MGGEYVQMVLSSIKPLVAKKSVVVPAAALAGAGACVYSCCMHVLGRVQAHRHVVRPTPETVTV
jgi:hypothetical protein